MDTWRLGDAMTAHNDSQVIVSQAQQETQELPQTLASLKANHQCERQGIPGYFVGDWVQPGLITLESRSRNSNQWLPHPLPKEYAAAKERLDAARAAFSKAFASSFRRPA